MLLMTETCPNCGEELTSDNAAGGLCGRCLFERGIELTNTVVLADGSTPGTHPFIAPDPVEVEADLLSFDVLELIGQGGMGAVYKAYQRSLDRTVAIKILPRQAAGGHEFAERFQREARALARLRHENIVMAYDYGLTDRYLYSVMEYVGGPNLRELLSAQCSHHAPRDETQSPLPQEAHRQSHTSLPPRRALEIARDVCAALQFAHENGVIHRDIKPENILLDVSGRVKIADFGLAKLLQPDPRELALTHTRHFMGTVHYMAPEQSERPHETDHRADIYSVGVVLYEMLTGELPLGRFDPPSSRGNVDPRVDDVVLRALKKDPARRPQTASAFAEAITSLVETLKEPQSATAQPAVISDGGRTGRRPLIAVGFLGFLLIAYFGWQFLLKYQRDKDGNTTLTVKAEGGDGQASELSGRSTADPAGGSTVLDDQAERQVMLAVNNDPEVIELRSVIREREEEYQKLKSYSTYPKSDTAVRRVEKELANLKKAEKQLVAQLREIAIVKHKYGGLGFDYHAEEQDDDKQKAKMPDESPQSGPVEIEFFGPDQSQMVLRGDPKDIDRVVELLKQIQGAKQNEKPEDVIRRLRNSGAAKQGDAWESEQILQVFQLKAYKASEVTDLLRKVKRGDAGRFETDNRTNSIIAMADRDTMSRVEALLKQLEPRNASAVSASNGAGNQTKIFSLEHADAAEAEQMLRKLYSDDSAVRMTADNRTNSLIIEGDSETLTVIEAILLRLDENGASKTGDSPTTITRRHVLQISVAGTQPNAPIDGRYNIDLDGYVNLGAAYGKVKVIALTAQQAEDAILKKLRETLREPKVVVSIEEGSTPSGSAKQQLEQKNAGPIHILKEAHALRISVSGTVEGAPIDGLYTLDLDGYVNLGAEHGKVKVAGLTADEAEKAVLAELSKVLRNPTVVLTIEERSQAQPPIRISAQIRRDDLTLRVPFTIEGKLAGPRARYFLVADGPRMGRVAFDVTPAMGLGGYGAAASPAAGSNEGLLNSDKGLSIASGETIEVFIEEKANRQGAKPVRVSNIVSLTWDLPDPNPAKAKRKGEPQNNGNAAKSSADRTGQSPTMTLAERGWELKLDRAGIVKEARQLPAEQWASRVESEMADRWRKSNLLKQKLDRLREFNTRFKNTPEGKEIEKQVEHVLFQTRLLEPKVGGPTTQIPYPPRDPSRDNLVTVFDLPHHSTQIIDQWPMRDADLPVGLRYSEDVLKEFGKLAVEYRFYDHTPTTIIYRDERGDVQAVIPYVLVIKGPHLGQKEYVLSDWPRRDRVQDLDRTPGIIFAPANLRISNGEPLQIHIERGDPRSSTRVRASNIVKLTWTIPGAPTTDIRYPEKLMKPFTAIHWENGRPQVELNDLWHEIVAINGHSIDKILEHAKKTYPDKQETTFENDLPLLMHSLDEKPSGKFHFDLRRLDNGQRHTISVQQSP